VLAAVTLPLLSVGGWVGICLIDRLRASWEVQEVVAEIDRDDPDWTFEEILARRQSVPDEKNGVLRLASVHAMIPKEEPVVFWHVEPDDPEFPEQERRRQQDEESQQIRWSIDGLEPWTAYDSRQLDYLRSRHQKTEAAFREALKLADYPQGRYKVNWPPDSSTETFESAEAGGGVVVLLADGALLRAHENDPRGACRCVRAMLHIGHYAGDEPSSTLYLYREFQLRTAVSSLERVLGQGRPDVEDLLGLQRLLEGADRDEPASLRIALRGERAWNHWEFQAYDRGKHGARRPVPWWDREPSLDEYLWETPRTRHGHAVYLRLMTEWINQCGGPSDRLAKLEQKHDQALSADKRATRVAKLLSIGPSACRAGFQLRAYLRCAYVLAAAERYHREKGAWPLSLETLIPHYLKQVPADPYDGMPLRYKHLADGLVVYSVGPDLTDNGGRLNRQNPTAPGADLGFQLWDADKRGRAAPAK
jgi:hypothetical protein